MALTRHALPVLVARSARFLVAAAALAWGAALTAAPAAGEEGDRVLDVELRHAVGPRNLAPVRLLLRVRGGGVADGFAMAPHVYPEPARTLDASGLRLAGDRLTGTVRVVWRTPMNLEHQDRPHPDIPATYDLDVTFTGEDGTGTASGSVGERRPESVEATPVRATRRALDAPPETVQFELAVYRGYQLPRIGGGAAAFTRLTTRGGKADRAFMYYGVRDDPTAAAEAVDVTFEGTALLGRWTATCARVRRRITYTVRGTVLGRFVALEAEMTDGDQTWSCGGLGRVNLSKRPWPQAAPARRTWTVAYTREPDPALVKEAAAQAQEPLGVLQPTATRLLWTWRLLFGARGETVSLAPRGGPFAAIHAPAFDLAPLAGAASYRFSLTGEGGTHTFTADTPTHSLVPVWGAMAPATYRLTVVGLGPDGDTLATPIEARYLPYAAVRGKAPEPATTDAVSMPIPDGFDVTKRPAFQGPYFDPPRDGYAAALAAARFIREKQHLGQHKGLAPYPGLTAGGGDGKQNYRLMDHSMTNLVVYRFSDDPGERADALDWARHVGAAGEINSLSCKTNLVNTYKFNTNTYNVAGDAFLNLYAATKDPRWKEAALRFARGLARQQKPDGGFRWVTNGGQVYRWPDTFGATLYYEGQPSELLCFFGRLRHELGTDEFAEVEAKALAYLRRWVREQFLWVEVGPHSHCWAYPLRIHSVSPQHFALYLAAYAREAERDVALAEELALWSEDRNIRWDRAEPEPGGPVRPRGFGSCDGYRSSGPPASFTARLALVYLALYRHTKRPLHLEKARALFAAVLMAQDPETGELNRAMECASNRVTWPHYKHQIVGPTLWYLIEYETLAREVGLHEGTPR